MRIYYIDELGEVAADIDNDTIQFCGGLCYFTSGGKEYRIPLAALIEICG